MKIKLTNRVIYVAIYETILVFTVNIKNAYGR